MTYEVDGYGQFRAVTTSNFRRRRDRLPPRIQRRADEAFRTFKTFGPDDSSLRSERHDSRRHDGKIYRCELSGSHRAMAEVHNEDGTEIFVFYWIGSHEAYNKRIKLDVK